MNGGSLQTLDRCAAVRPPVADAFLGLPPCLFDIEPFCRMDDREFEMRFMEQVVAGDPCCEDALLHLGAMYSWRGDFRKGLDVDRRLVRLRPCNATAHYNLACSHALLEELDEALAAMERAVNLGYRDMGHLLKDPDLANLRKDTRFRKLMGRIVEGAIRKS
jgi:hypothetical protein